MTTTQANKDRELSFSIINYLSASYRGKLAGYTLLGQMEHSSFEVGEISVLQHMIERIAEWLAGFTKGELLFSSSWETPETFEAQNALSLLDKLKPDLLSNAQQITNFLEGKEKIDSENAKWLFSNLIRSAFARDIYLRGFILYGETYNNTSIVENYNNLLSQATQHNAIIQQGIEIFREAKYDLNTLGDNFLMTLLAGCEELPSVFRTHAQDINLLSANYKGGVSFENLDFNKEEASAWLLAGITPEPAGYWRAFGFGPQESIEWLNSFVNDPGEANAWKMSNMLPAAVKPWKESGFIFNSAMNWIQAGYAPHIAKEHVDRGIFSPPPESE